MGLTVASAAAAVSAVPVLQPPSAPRPTRHSWANQVVNSVLMRITADVRKLVLDAFMRVSYEYVKRVHAPNMVSDGCVASPSRGSRALQPGASILQATYKSVAWGSTGSDDVTSDRTWGWRGIVAAAAVAMRCWSAPVHSPAD